MDWPDTIEVTIDGIAQGGEGVGRWEGRVVFVRGGLPGERVVVQVHERKEAYARGEIAALLVASPDRVDARDAEADHMPWQHIDHVAQLRFKRQILVEQLAKIGGLADVPVAETLPTSQPWGYRNSARFHVRRGEVGYFAAGTRELRPVAHDPLLLPILNDVLATLRLLLDEGDGVSEVALRASEANGYVIAALRGRNDLRTLGRRWMTRSPQLAGVAVPGDDVGTVEITEELGGVSFLLRPESFFQVNLGAARSLLTLVQDGLKLQGDERLVDLYCGVGTFALPLARHVVRVSGIEEFEGAVRDAERTAEANKIANARFQAGVVERALASFQHGAEALVMDPPRRGCHPRALAEIIRLAPRRVVYVSCHPGTLARDLKILAEGGYCVLHITPVDLFPQTPHIESVSVLEKAE